LSFLFCSHKYQKIETYFIVQVNKNTLRIIVLFAQKIVTKLSKYGFGILDPRSRGKKGARFWFRIINAVVIAYVGDLAGLPLLLFQSAVPAEYRYNFFTDFPPTILRI
jgi:hypothetical protein